MSTHCHCALYGLTELESVCVASDGSVHEIDSCTEPSNESDAQAMVGWLHNVARISDLERDLDQARGKLAAATVNYEAAARDRDIAISMGRDLARERDDARATLELAKEALSNLLESDSTNCEYSVKSGHEDDVHRDDCAKCETERTLAEIEAKR